MPPEQQPQIPGQDAAQQPAQQVQYGGDEFAPNAAAYGAAKPDMADRLIGWGIAGDRQQAQYILIGVAVVCASVAIYFAFFSGPSAPTNLPPGTPTLPGPGMPGSY